MNSEQPDDEMIHKCESSDHHHVDPCPDVIRGHDPRKRDWPFKENLKFLCAPDGTPDFHAWKSPAVTPFKDPLFIPPIAQSEAGGIDQLQPKPKPYTHQKWAEFPPKIAYRHKEKEFQWQFHSDYGKSWTWGYDATNANPHPANTIPGNNSQPANHVTPGPTFQGRYGESVLIRRINELPMVGYQNVKFALPSTTMHRHNGHQASESDGDPTDWIDPGDFWDHHYPGSPSTFINSETGLREPDEREKLTTLWYHDHRMDYTAANIYAGIVGFYTMFDEFDITEKVESDGTRTFILTKEPQDIGIESPAEIRSKVEDLLGRPIDEDEERLLDKAWRLPSGEFDIPLILQDLLFDKAHQLVFDGFAVAGVIGDRFTVNRIIQPHLIVKRRKYRFRILNGGPSRFYQVFLHVGEEHEENDPNDRDFIIISGDGNFQPEPVESKSIVLGVAQRVDIIIDFSNFSSGDKIYLENRLEQHHGHGPSGRKITDPIEIKKHRLMQFIVGEDAPDESRIPDFFRSFPPVNLDEVKRQRTWIFDHDGGLWTINGRDMDPHRSDAGIERDSAEIWTFRNNGNNWWHPLHNHLSEWLVLEVNGIPVSPDSVQINANARNGKDFQKVFTLAASNGADYLIGKNVLRGPWCGGFRRDIALLGPRTEITMFNRWADFLGKHVLHCHNVVHEDHTMMIRWDVVPPGQGFEDPKSDSEIYGTEHIPPHIEMRPAQATAQHGSRPYSSLINRQKACNKIHLHGHSHQADTYKENNHHSKE